MKKVEELLTHSVEAENELLKAELSALKEYVNRIKPVMVKAIRIAMERK